MSAGVRLLFALGARLHMSAAAVEHLSAREVAGWVEFFQAEQSAAPPDAPDVHSLSRAELRAMFPGGRA